MCLKPELQKGGAALKHWFSGLCECGALPGKRNLNGFTYCSARKKPNTRQYFLHGAVEEEKLQGNDHSPLLKQPGVVIRS